MNESFRKELNPYRTIFNGAASTSRRKSLDTEILEDYSDGSSEVSFTAERTNEATTEFEEQKIEQIADENQSALQELPFYSEAEEEENLYLEEQHECLDLNEEVIAVNEVTENLKKTKDEILSDMLVTDKDLNVWTGIPNHTLLESISVSVQSIETCYPKRFKLHTVDRVILTFVRIKQNISFVALATLFRVSPTTVGDCFEFTIQRLAEVLGQLVRWPAMNEISRNIPHCFKNGFENVRCVLDCTEVGIGTPNCLNCRIATYSSYKHKRTVKLLIGVTPAGLISFCSRAYSGKASDKFIFNNENFIDKLTPHQDQLMVDKGFNIRDECLGRGIKLHIPPFLRGERLTEEEALLNERIAKARIHVERVIARIKLFGVLKHSLDLTMLKHINEIMLVICGMVNLSPPVLKDNKF